MSPDNGIIHHDASHTYEYSLLNFAAMDDGIMSDTHIVPDDCLTSFISAMDDGTILDVYTLSHAYAIHISASHTIEPEAAFISTYHISDEIGSRSDVDVLTQTWSEPSTTDDLIHLTHALMLE
jgi:hypothetical protein